MRRIESIAELEALYGTPGQAALDKVADRLTPSYRRWVEASRFCILSTVGPGGTDASPRGDDGPVVRLADDRTLLLPTGAATTGSIPCGTSLRTGACR